MNASPHKSSCPKTKWAVRAVRSSASSPANSPDIYISCVSFAHEVAPPGIYICLVSTTVETNNPQKELAPGVAYLGNVLQQFWSVDPLFESSNDWKKEGIHISKSYDATSHFETISDDVIRIYKEITGETNVSHLFVPKEKKEEK